MNDPQKFRIVAESLRELVTEPKFRQGEVLALLALFERLAIEAEAEQESELNSLFSPQSLSRPRHNGELKDTPSRL